MSVSVSVFLSFVRKETCLCLWQPCSALNQKCHSLSELITDNVTFKLSWTAKNQCYDRYLWYTVILVGVHKEYHLCRLDLKFPFSFQLVKTHGLGCVKMITLLGGVQSGRKSRRRQGISLKETDTK